MKLILATLTVAGLLSTTALAQNNPGPFKICDNQTYALCAVASCFVFNEVAYCKCDVKFGDSISLSFDFDDQDVCTVNAMGAANGYMVSTFSVPDSVLVPNGDQAVYTCPAGLRMEPMPNAMAGSASPALRGSHFLGSANWRKARSSAPARSRKPRREQRSDTKLLALTPAKRRSSRTARRRRLTRKLARRFMSAHQPVLVAYWPFSSPAPIHPRTNAVCYTIDPVLRVSA